VENIEIQNMSTLLKLSVFPSSWIIYQKLMTNTSCSNKSCSTSSRNWDVKGEKFQKTSKQWVPSLQIAPCFFHLKLKFSLVLSTERKQMNCFTYSKFRSKHLPLLSPITSPWRRWNTQISHEKAFDMDRIFRSTKRVSRESSTNFSLTDNKILRCCQG
jgi:hypothetical protein